MKHRRLIVLAALLLSGVVVWFGLHAKPAREHLPGAEQAQRQLLRIWVVDAIGGSESWLRDCLKDWEKANPGAMTFLRRVSADELVREDAVLPDILLYTPGSIAEPDKLFLPYSGNIGVKDELLRAGRWKGQQYGLPLCFGGYALAIDSSIEPHLAVTPAPTTLLGKPRVTADPAATPTPGFPASATLLAPKGCGLFTLGLLLDEHPALPEGFATTDAADVFRRFQAKQASSALLTTGQVTALGSTTPLRIMTPGQVITDQVFFASVFPGASNSAARLLTYLTSTEAQRKLSGQGLHTVRDDLRLYVSGTEALIETAASRSLAAINAYGNAADTEAAAWQFFHGRITLDDALLPLL